MRYGRGRTNWHDINWYDFIIAGLAAVIVYPDKVLEWVGERTGKEFGLRHLVYLEIVAISLLLVLTTLLMPHYPNLEWWYPLVFVGFFGLLRFLTSIVIGLFGFNK